MALDSLNALFEDMLRDMYYAEKKLTRILPKMAKKATTPELADAFTSHAEETKAQIDRIEQVFGMIDKTPRASDLLALPLSKTIMKKTSRHGRCSWWLYFSKGRQFSGRQSNCRAESPEQVFSLSVARSA